MQNKHILKSQGHVYWLHHISHLLLAFPRGFVVFSLTWRQNKAHIEGPARCRAWGDSLGGTGVAAPGPPPAPLCRTPSHPCWDQSYVLLEEGIFNWNREFFSRNGPSTPGRSGASAINRPADSSLKFSCS